VTGTGRTFLLGLAAGVVLATLAFEFSTQRLEPDLQHYRSVRDFARESFVREVSNQELLDHALHGMLSSLDSYSRYYDRDESESVARETVGRYVGMGVVFRGPITDGVVLFPLADSPGKRAGLRVGDQLLELDGRALADFSEAQIRTLVEASEAVPVDMLVEGRDGGQRALKLRAESIVNPTVRHTRMLDEERGIGYTSILSFSQETPREFDEAFQYLARRDMNALVLDLRANYGGVLESAVEIARRFIDDGLIVSTEGRGQPIMLRSDAAEALHVGFPLVVLVDGDSASASEVLAGALQDHRAAIITGSRSYGKGMVQTIRRFERAGARAKVTSSYYYSPTHRNFERSSHADGAEGEHGIYPDLVIEANDGERRAVHAFLDSYGAPLEALDALAAWEREVGQPLVGLPPTDKQLEAAVGLLSGERPGPYAVSLKTER
jgi:carboxyl-terminal processing protease